MIQHENKMTFANFKEMIGGFGSFSKKNVRFVYPVLIVVSAKLLSNVFFYYSLNLSSAGTAWLSIWGVGLPPHPSRWPFLYNGWDSGWFFGIVYRGYSGQPQYAFFPGFPIVAYLLNLMINDILASAAICSLIFGVAWIPFFQAIAEHYMTREEASRTTLLAAFFPYVFLFTTVAYSESLFLFACTASWYFYLNRKTLNANILAGVAAITRMVGIVMALPMFLDMLHKRERKPLLYLLIPSVALFAWVSYCFVKTGDWLASISAQNKYWNMYTFPKWLINFISTQRLINIPSEISGIIMIILTSLLIYYGRKVDWRLTAYSVASFLVIIYFGAMWSISRYLSFIFPIWINLGTQTLRGKSRNVLTAALCFFFFSLAILIWYQFLLSQWVA